VKRIVLALSVVAVLTIGSLVQAGAWGGPRLFISQSVLGNDYSYADVHFVGGQWAEVELDGYGVTDLDLVVMDSYGNAVAIDENYSDNGYVSFYVPFSQTYRIAVVNNGIFTNFFDLATN
jgi:hypothetical protein